VVGSLGTFKNKNDQYPEEVEVLDYDVTMSDNHFLLMQQCLKDARELYKMCQHFSGSNIYISDWRTYEQCVVSLARELFRKRSKNPVTQKTLKKLLMSGEDAKQTFVEMAEGQKELLSIINDVRKNVKLLEQAKREYKNTKIEIKQMKISAKAKNFLRFTIGDKNMNILSETGRLEVLGDNGHKYVIHKNGIIEKKSKGGLMGTFSDSWRGKISDTSGLPMEDAIAIVYSHILEGANLFDKKKKCGNISVSR
jgi:hypothetical protein